MNRYASSLMVAVLLSLHVPTAAESKSTLPLHADRAADPRIALADGRGDLRTHPAFPGSTMLRRGQAVPVAMTQVDLDRDGAADLVVGYRLGRRGLVASYPGRINAVVPSSNAPDAATPPFRDHVSAVDLPWPPQWLGASDFDADGCPDVVVATLDVPSLGVLLGDGHGGITTLHTIAVDGPVTALEVAQFGQLDGFPDVIVGLESPRGPEVHVYKSPNGLLRGEAEEHPLPAAARVMVVAELTGDHLTDLAIAAGRELFVVHGRDVLPWVQEGPAPYATPAVVDRWMGEAEIVSVTAARSGSGRSNAVVLDARGILQVLARQPGENGETNWRAVGEVPALRDPIRSPVLMPLRTSSVEGDDLLIVDRRNRRLHFLSLDTTEVLSTFDVAGIPAAALPMRLNADGQSDLVLLVEDPATPMVVLTSPRATFTVDSTGESHDATPGDGNCADPSGTCTLRSAIEEANAHSGADAIGFSLRSSTIAVTLGALPTITDPVTIVGSAAGIPRIELDGSGAGISASGLTLGPGSSSSMVRSLVINRFPGDGIRIESADNRIEDCYIGPDRDGRNAVPGNNASGVLITGAAAVGNTVGAGDSAARNVISNNGTYGVEIANGASGNTLVGNLVGTDPSGDFAVPNGSIGIRIRSGANGNIIGGATESAGEAPGNVVSANGSAGVFIESNGNAIHGNSIGGGPGLGNALRGVGIAGSSNTIGGASVALRNVISGNLEAGVTVGSASFSASTLNAIQGNFIGVDTAGTASLGNAASGVRFQGGVAAVQDNMIGGLTHSPGAPPGNVISANLLHGVELFFPPIARNFVAGNLIGADSSGGHPLPNGGHGVLIRGSDSNVVGGLVSQARNVIVGGGIGGPEAEEPGQGIEIQESRGTTVAGNYIGTDITGTVPLGLTGDGVSIVDLPNIVSPIENNRIGGSTLAERNVISGNLGNGVRLSGAAVTGNTVTGNFIGLDATGTGILGNLGNGVIVTGGAHGNRIGGESGSTPGDCTGECNAIAWNSEAGVRVDVASSVDNSIRGNSIFQNGGLGIDLEPSGVNPNDALDADTGPNDLQNFPTVTSIAFDGSSTTVSGVLASAPDSTFVVDVFGNTETDPSGSGEGRAWLGSATAITDGAGHGSFTVTAPGSHALASATATIAGGSTSEFGAVQPSPGEVGELLVSKGPGSALTVGYEPACGATGHVAYVGSHGPGPLGGLVWSAAHCGLGTSGAAAFDPGLPASSGLLYFVVVGQDAEQEGSYGSNASGFERPEAVAVGACDRPRAVLPGCP